jgi:ribonuclease P/MRP protein subunit RPP40
MFVCYINDLPEKIASFIFLYADDTKVFRRVDCDLDRDELQRDLDRLADWAMKWQLRFNIDKCKILHLGGTRNRNESYSMIRPVDGVRETLRETTEEKDLGVWMDCSAKPSVHVKHAVNKANQLLGLIRRGFTFMDCDLMRRLFTSVVRPHLEYANIVWHPYLRSDIDLLESVQHRATRMVPGLSKLSYEERLRRLDLPTLAYRRVRGDAIDTFKYLKGIYRVDHTGLLQMNQSGGPTTRGNGMKLQKRSCQSQLRLNFYSMRIVSMWNSLPEEVVGAASVNCFKGRFDRCCIRNRFSMEWEKITGRHMKEEEGAKDTG